MCDEQNNMLHDLGNIEIVAQKSLIKTQNTHRDIETKTQAAPLNKITKKQAAAATSQHATKTILNWCMSFLYEQKNGTTGHTDKSQQYLHSSKTHRHETHKMTNVRHRLHERMQLKHHHTNQKHFNKTQANEKLKYKRQHLINAL